MNKKKMYILSIVGLAVLIYLIISLILYSSQRSLLYHPTENNYSGDMLTVSIEKIKIKNDCCVFNLTVYLLMLSGNPGLLGWTFFLFFFKRCPKYDFCHELGRRRSFGCETTAVLHGISTRIEWDQFWTLK